MKYNCSLFNTSDIAVSMSKVMHHLDEENICDVVPLSLNVPDFNIDLIK